MANQDFLTNEKDFEIPEGWAEVGPRPEPAGAPGPSIPIDRFASGAVSSMTLGLNTDIAASKIGGDVPSFRIQPPQPSSIAAANSASQSIIKQTQIVEGPGVLFETNGIKDPNQEVQNAVPGTGISITVDNAGNKTFSATSQTQVAQWPLPNTALTFMSRAIVGTTSLQTIGDASTQTQSAGTGALSGAGSLPTASEGVFQQITTGAGTGNALFTWFPVNSKIFRAGRNNKYQARSRFPTAGDISASQVWCGFSDQSDLRPTIGVVNVAAILSDFGVWKGVIYNAGVLTSILLTGTPDTATHDFEIDLNDTANTATFLIDGVVAGSISGKNPTGLNWFPLFSLMNKTVGGTTANVNFQYMYAQQDF
jgi:hypothetical protein